MSEYKKGEYKTMEVHGQEYVMVVERIRHFWELYPNGMIETILCVDIEYLSYLAKGMKVEDRAIFLVRAVVTPDVSNPERYITGQAYEVEGSNNVNDGNALENCETSAIGRALAFLGIGLIGGIASADEMRSATAPKQNGEIRPASEAQKNFISSLRGTIAETNPDVLIAVDGKVETMVKEKGNVTSQEASDIINYLKTL
jgi:hypothetical protein|tara:strand:- start:1470 stop:2069 length:600 start_codon:yes stop_codon:yes gene_type:complete